MTTVELKRAHGNRMKTPPDVVIQMTKKFRTRREKWLADLLAADLGKSEGADDWPYVISLEPPTSGAASRHLGEVSEWVENWHRAAERMPGQVTFETRVLALMGKQNLPSRLEICSIDEAVRWAGLESAVAWKEAVRRARAFVSRWPELREQIAKEWDLLTEWPEDDVKRLMTAVAWFEAHRSSGLFVRQLPIEGVDTKWYTSGKRRKIVMFLSVIRRARGEVVPEKAGFEEICGLRELPPPQIRVRLLDDELRAAVGGLGDLSATPEELARLPIRPDVVFFSENKESGLAFEDMPGAAVVLGLGNNLAGIETIPWIADAPCLYWGDLDTFGFRILSEARQHLPGIRSVMMDKVTLLAHKPLWVVEGVQTKEAILPNLTKEEAEVYAALKSGTYDRRVRLEQERIPWPYARRCLAEAAAEVLAAQAGIDVQMQPDLFVSGEGGVHE